MTFKMSTDLLFIDLLLSIFINLRTLLFICLYNSLSIYLSIYLYIYNVFLCKIYGLLGLVRVQNKQSNSFFGPNILVICLWPFSLHFFIHKFFVFFIFYGSHMKVFIDNVFSYFRNTIKYLLCVECFLHLNVHRFFTLKIFLGYKSKISYFMIEFAESIDFLLKKKYIYFVLFVT